MGATTASVVAGASGGAAMPNPGGTLAPVKGGGGAADIPVDMLPALAGIVAALKALVDELGRGGAAAAVAGASGEVAAGGPSKDAASGSSKVAKAVTGPGQQTRAHAQPTDVAGVSGVGQVPTQAPTQAPTKVASASGPGEVKQTPGRVGQMPGNRVPVKVTMPVTQVASQAGPAPDAPTKVEPAKVEPVKVEPARSVPVQSQTPAQSQPVQAPAPKPVIAGDVRLLELDSSNVMQLVADDGSYLYFNADTVGYRSRTGQVREAKVPTTGLAVSLSDGTKFSYGLYDKTAWGEQAGTPRDIEILSPDGRLVAARTDDGDSTSWADTPLTSFHLLEVASMLFDGSYAKFGNGSGVVQQSANAVRQTAT